MARNYVKKKFIYWHSIKLNKKAISFLEANVTLFPEMNTNYLHPLL